MSGKPGRSGGKRPGAGRPIQTVTLREGQQWAMITQPGGLATVHIEGRNRITLSVFDSVTGTTEVLKLLK